MKKLRRSFIDLLILLNDSCFHTGDELGKSLNITRAAVWKLVNQLKMYGIDIYSERGKGYCLSTPTLFLDEKKIEKLLKSYGYEIKVDVYLDVDSTNTYLQKQTNTSQISLCMAEKQTHGRGRLQRSWVSPFAKNLYYSCSYPFCQDVAQLSGLSLLVSLVVVNTLKQFGIKQGLTVKWPNDVLYKGKKISGVLIDLSAQAYADALAIIGIGINVNMLDDAGQIDQLWISMQQILGHYIDRNLLCIALTKILISHLQKFNAKGFTSFLEEWSSLHCLHQEEVMVYRGVEKIIGVVNGVDELGQLLLQVKNGDILKINSGEVKIRKKSLHD